MSVSKANTIEFQCQNDTIKFPNDILKIRNVKATNNIM